MRAPTASDTATIQEVFSGIQGEGLLVGYRQIFVRFHGCQVYCRYCDTPATFAPAPVMAQVEQSAGERDFIEEPNPLALDRLLDCLDRLQAGFRHHSVSLTGGEPLLHRPFLDALLPALHARGFASYLETNGLCPQELRDLAVPPHYIAMDIKLPSAAGIAPRWDEHAAFLTAALEQLAKDDCGLPLTERLQAKIVFAEDSLAEVEVAAKLLAACRADIPCILQPVTTRPGGPTPPTPATVLEAQRLASARLTNVRVIPQTHVMLGQR
ncbi:MAG TPA: 7-carboxy-7-deazaguanine synthase QueE [Armatimonadota bacterium]|jgi:organic radical activating enzyme